MGAPKERASSAYGANGAYGAASAAITVAGFPGVSAVRNGQGGATYPLMGDDRCQVPAGALCPADTSGQGSAGEGGERTAGMLRHGCDTDRGMSGAPLWVRGETREARLAGIFADRDGLPGSYPAGAAAAAAVTGDTEAVAAAPGPGPGRGVAVTAFAYRPRPAVAVGVVSRHDGECPYGPDCINLAAALDAGALETLKRWVAAA